MAMLSMVFIGIMLQLWLARCKLCLVVVKLRKVHNFLIGFGLLKNAKGEKRNGRKFE